MRIVIGTKNAGKIEGVKQAFAQYFEDVEVIGIPVESEVPDQPVKEQTYLGAQNRLENIKKYVKENKIEADYYAAIESGITNSLGEWGIINIALIEDNNGVKSFGTSPCFPVPEQYVTDVIQNNLSIVMDRILGKDEQRHNQKGGIQLLTKGAVTRIDLTRLAFTMALTKYINGEKWK